MTNPKYVFARPLHEATLLTKGGRTRWTCLCGKQMKGWSDDPQQVMRLYAEHAGLVEKRK